jgi:hypothetical protein
MKVANGTSKFVKAILLGLVLVVAMPALTFAQGRGRGRDKKIEKFVNGHDARDGRWDGRGPNRSSNVFRNRRWRDRNNDDRFGRQRRVDRDGDGDFDRRDVLLGRRNRVDRDGDGDFDRRDVLLGRRARRTGRLNR